MRHSRWKETREMSFETEMRERVKRGESLDSIMEELSSIANKLEAEKKNNPRKDYVKELENSYMEKAILLNASRNLEIASIIMTLDIADTELDMTRDELEDIYGSINGGLANMIQDLTNFIKIMRAL